MSEEVKDERRLYRNGKWYPDTEEGHAQWFSDEDESIEDGETTSRHIFAKRYGNEGLIPVNPDLCIYGKEGYACVASSGDPGCGGCENWRELLKSGRFVVNCTEEAPKTRFLTTDMGKWFTQLCDEVDWFMIEKNSKGQVKFRVIPKMGDKSIGTSCSKKELSWLDKLRECEKRMFIEDKGENT